MTGLAIAPASPAHAAAPLCGPPVASTTQPGYTVADPDCELDGTPFTALAGATAYTGIVDGAAYRIEKPKHWNGELVIYAHGYRGSGTTVFVDDPQLRAHWIGKGFAWAASSYQTNGYDVGQGVKDSRALVDLARSKIGRTRDVYMTGVSMGGHITGAAIEHYPATFAGAMPACGVLGDAELFDFFLDANVTAAALTKAPITFPLDPPADYAQRYANLVNGELPRLGTGFGTGDVRFTALGEQWSAVVERRSGGDRPGFDNAFKYWNGATQNGLPFLFGLYPGTSGGTLGIAEGNVTSNRHTVYQTDDHPALNPAERRLNRDVLRVAPTAAPSRDLSGIPLVAGRPPVPVVSLHDIGDLFVPISMEQVYASRAAANGRSKSFVSRAIRGVGHCDFTDAEMAEGFDSLVSWVRSGHRPAGDDILDPRAVANPRFGCRFTRATRPQFDAC